MRLLIALATGLIALPQAAHAQKFKSSAGDLKVETGADGARECTIVHPRIEEAAAPKPK